MLSFNDFVHKYNLKNKTTSNLKLYEVLKKIGLDTKVGNHLRDGPFSADNRIVNLQPSNVLIEFVVWMKITLIVMVVSVQSNYPRIL